MVLPTTKKSISDVHVSRSEHPLPEVIRQGSGCVDVRFKKCIFKEKSPKTCDGVQESLWKPHKSKDLTFLDRSYAQLFFNSIFFSNQKTKTYFLEIFFKIRENQKCQ